MAEPLSIAVVRARPDWTLPFVGTARPATGRRAERLLGLISDELPAMLRGAT